MACSQINNQTQTTVNNIVGLLKRIDQMQKEALINNANALCESCLMSAMYNTKPLSIYINNTLFTVNVGLSNETTSYFRVEEVRGNDTVVLRLLILDNGTLSCTNYTVVVSINCICCLQCYNPINCNFSNCNCLIEA